MSDSYAALRRAIAQLAFLPRTDPRRTALYHALRWCSQEAFVQLARRMEAQRIGRDVARP